MRQRVWGEHLTARQEVQAADQAGQALGIEERSWGHRRSAHALVPSVPAATGKGLPICLAL